jgi:CDP-glucose 4,6-dehydratase
VAGVVVSGFGDAFRNRRVLVTGHTGFKGSWLALWLRALGAEVTGLALDPITRPSHWSFLNLHMQGHIVDVRRYERVEASVREARPEIVFHLAAQPLVRRSYADPLETWATNVTGTANVLEAIRRTPEVRVVVVVTTDKVYENEGWERPYRERDPLGGHDPYSASKAAQELVARSYARSFFHVDTSSVLLATARAGNVIGGGDWSEDRLVADVVRAVETNSMLAVRFPDARRPWQHVLDCLSGYLRLGQLLLEGKRELATAWNFGPGAEANISVAQLIERLAKSWPAVSWQRASGAQPHEAELLHLDSSRARSRLGWAPVWSIDRALEATAAWYRDYMERGQITSEAQLARYTADALGAGAPWMHD